MRHALLAMGLTALAPVAAQASTGCTAINAGVLNHQVVYVSGAPAAGTTASASYASGTYHMSRSSAAWTDPFDPAMNYVPSNATFLTFDAGDQIVVTGNFTATSGTELRLRLRIGTGTGSASNPVSILRSTSGTESTVAYTVPAGTTAVGLTTGRFAGTSGTIVASATCTPAVSPPTLNSFTFGSTVAYNPGGASATSIDVATGGGATNAPTGYSVSNASGGAYGASGSTSGGGAVSISSAGIASYTPRVGYRGNDTFFVKATNSAGDSNPPATVTVSVGDPTITAAISGTGARVAAALSGYSVTPAGGNAPYSCVLNSGSAALPSGVTLGANCALTGTPTTAGTYNFNVDITDSSVTGANGGTAQPFTRTNVALTGFVIAQEMPTVTAISPIAGSTGGGTTVTITGSGFAAAPGTNAVKFGAANATYTINSNTQITATSPAGSAGTVDITVTTPGGTSAISAADQFTYVAAPTVTSISPTNGPTAGGITVVITGSGFAAAPGTNAVKFGAANASYTINSNTQITATVPANSAGTYDVRVTTPGGTSATSAADQFTYVAAPTVTSVSPTAGPTSGGTTVTITGSGFGAAPGTGAVKFGTTNATYTINSNSQITATAPASAAGTYDITVTTPGGPSATSASDQYTYVAAPVASSFTASAVAYNAASVNFSVAGHATNSPTNFAVGSATTAQGGSVSVDSAGLVTYTAPTGFRGNDSFTFTATNLGGTSAPATTTVPVSNPTLSSSLAGGSGTRGQALSGVQINTSGGRAPYSCGTVPASGSLPAGTAINADCTITGTPAASGTFTFTATVTDSSLGTGPFTQATGTLTLTIAAPTITLSPASGALPGATVGTGYSQSFTANGGTATYGYARTLGTLPTGLTLSGGTLSGTPTATGTFNFDITATDSSTAGSGGPYTRVQSYSVTVSQGAQTITFGPLSNASLSASPVNVSATASSGLTVSFASTTTGICTVSGTTVTLLQTGTCSITASQAGDGNWTAAPDVVQSFTVTPANLTINAAAATGLQVGAAYNQANAAAGGVAPYTYTLNAGAFVPGTTVNASTGVVSGTPTVAGSFSYIIRATDTQPVTADTGVITVTIAKGNQTLSFTSSAPGASVGGAAYTPTVTATSTLTPVLTIDAGSAGICTISGGSVTFNTPGTCLINANQAGDSNWNAAAQVQQAVAVSAASAITSSVSFSTTSLGVGQTGTATITFTNPNASASPSIAPLLSGSALVSRGTLGGSCGASGSDSGANFQFNGFSIPSGSCTVTIGYTGTTAGSTAGFSLGAFTPSGYPTTPAAASGSFAVVPTVTGVAPPSGPVSQVVTVSGTGFSTTPGNNTVTFGSAGNGTVTAASATSLTVTAPAAGSGAKAVTVTVNGQTSTTSATFTFIDKPIAANKPGVAVPYNSTGTAIDLSASITGGPHSSISIGTAPTHGTTSIAGDVVTYTPTAGYFGADSFTYTATGPGGTSNIATVSLTVATPTAPTAADTSAAIPYNSTGTAIDLAPSISGVYSSVAIGTAPTHGTVSIAGTVVTYTPTTNYFGSDSFTYTATGPGGTSVPATVTLTVANPPAPVAANRSGVAVPYASTGTAIDLTSSITGVHTSIAVASAPANGTVTISGNVVTYTPNATYFGADSFTYTATGPGGTSAPATVSVTVATPGAPAVAGKLGVAVPYASSGTAIDLTSTITGVHTSIAVASAPSAGTTTVAGNVVTYTPNATYFGPDSFTYTATGPGGTSTPAMVTLTVATPAAPAAADKSGVAVPYASSGTAIDLTSSVTGVHNGIAVMSAPAHGTATMSGYVVTYTPSATYFGPDSFTYIATGPGGNSALATVSLTVATPAAPVAADRNGVAVPYAGSGTAIDLTSSITGVHTGIAVASAPAHGTVTVSGNVVTYTPSATYFGADSFTYTATGPGGTSTPATVTLTVATPGAPTVANRSGVAVPYASSGTAIDLTSSISGVHTSIAVASAPTYGTTTVAGNVVTYTPNATYFGPDSFTYTATGPGGTSTPAMVTLTVATPPAPVAANLSGVAVPYAGSGTAIDLTSSITGVHNGIAVASAPAHGTVTVAGNVVTYTPNATYFGSDSFTYIATGPGGNSAPATVSLTVAVPPAPTVADRSGVAVPYAGSGTAIDLSSSITGVHTSIAVATAPAHGTVTVSGNVVTYTPSATYFGADSFTYTATGPGGTSTPATVSMTVANPPAPVAANRSGVAVGYNSPGTAIDLTSSISGVHTSVAITTMPAHGTATVSGNVVTYVPTAGYYGADSFAYTATGPGGTSSPATVSMTVANPPAPVTAPGTGSVSGNTTGTNNSVAIDLSALVSGVYGSIQVATQPAHGTVTLSAGAPYIATYKPALNYAGADSFTFVAVGPGGTSTPGTVTVTVVGQVPVATPKTAKTGDGQIVSVMLTDGADRGPFTGATVVSVTPANSATTAIVAVGAGAYRLDVTPNNRFGGTIVVTYTLNNVFGTSAPSTVTLTVEARPDPRTDPVVGAISDAQAETARRFARAQVSNFMRRAEQLHGDSGGAGTGMGITLNSRDGSGMIDRFDDSTWGLLITDRMRRSSEDPAIGRVANDLRSPLSRADALGDGRMLATAGGVTGGAGLGIGGGNANAAAEPGSGSVDEDGKRRIGSLALWAGGAIEIGTRNETTDRSKISATTAGLSGGADIKLADGIIVGVGGGYGNDLSRIGTAAQVRGTSSLYAAYASILPVDGIFVDGMVGRGQLDFSTRRFVGAVNSEARGSRDGSYTVAALSLGVDQSNGPLQWSLYGRGEYLDADLDAYAETGAGRYNLRFDEREVRSVIGTIGGRIQYRQKVGFGSITPRLRAEWNHEFADIDPQLMDYADIPGAAFYSLSGNGWSREQFQLSLGTRVEHLLSGWALDFETGWRGGQGSRAGTLQLRASRRF